MRLPFVSRERLEEQQRRCEKLEIEVRELLLLALPGLRPQLEMAPLTPETDLSGVVPISGRPTLAIITANANRAAQQRAKQIGSMPISQELAEAQLKGWRDAKRG